MKCPKCESNLCRKNGRKSGKQNYLCKNCGRQFLECLPFDLTISPQCDARGGLPVEAHNGHAPISPSAPLVSQLLVNTDSELFTEAASLSLPSFLEPGVSILLLDAENLKLNVEVETFLASICKYDLQVKIAFANWKNPSIGKHDVELYERGYQLVHVPGGKDSADGKMIALGSSILQQYSNVKEVFVCSSDRILTHLCNQLQSQGLTVYWVQRQAQSLKIENRNNGQINHYSLTMGMAIPSFEVFVQKIEDMIKAEQESIAERLDKLSAVATLFQEKCRLTLPEHSFNNSDEISSQAALDRSLTKNKLIQSTTTALTTDIKSIDSKEELEKALIQILYVFQRQSPQTQLSVAKLGTELRRVSGQTPNSIIKKLKLGSSFTKFLNSCSIFKLKKTDKQYEVAIR